jgi:hypothetical protein
MNHECCWLFAVCCNDMVLFPLPQKIWKKFRGFFFFVWGGGGGGVNFFKFKVVPQTYHYLFIFNFMMWLRWQTSISLYSQIWLLSKYPLCLWLPTWTMYRNIMIFLDVFFFWEICLLSKYQYIFVATHLNHVYTSSFFWIFFCWVLEIFWIFFKKITDFQGNAFKKFTK